MLTVLNRLALDRDASLTMSAVNWLTTRWLIWYEAHSKKRQELYEYRKTARLNRDLEQDVELAEDEMPDMEAYEVSPWKELMWRLEGNLIIFKLREFFHLL